MLEKENTLFNRILIIDDDFTSTLVTRVMLEKMQVAQQVVTAIHGGEGLAFIEKSCLKEQTTKADCPDLILLDINMPVMDGFGFLEALKDLGQSNLIQTQVVVLTSSLHEGDQDRIASYGVRGYLVKPLTEQHIKWLLALVH